MGSSPTGRTPRKSKENKRLWTQGIENKPKFMHTLDFFNYKKAEHELSKCLHDLQKK